MEDENNNIDFEIKIDFSPGEGDPTRPFKAMSGLIESFQSLDSHILSTFDVSISTSLVLDEVEAGSIKAKLRDIIQGLPDEALKNSEWKKIIGHFLLKAKYIVLEWLEERNNIESREDVRILENRLKDAAAGTDIKMLPAYTSPSAEVLLSDIHSIKESLEYLEEDDTASYEYDGNCVPINKDLNISNEVIREVLTKEVVRSSGEKILKVKKPDYLGTSKWQFKYDGRAIEAKITDAEWLAKFQSRKEDVRPGDSLRVMLYEEISYGFDGEVVHRHYEIEKVYEVIRPPTQGRISF